MLFIISIVANNYYDLLTTWWQYHHLNLWETNSDIYL